MLAKRKFLTVSTLFTLLVLCSAPLGWAAEVLWDGQSPLSLDAAMEFTVAPSKTLAGNEVWQTSDSDLNRQPSEYLHFRTKVFSHEEYDQTLWFAIPFPAIKQLTVTDGRSIWVTGDDLPFFSRPIESADYLFPVYLKGGETTTIQGSMQGDILRYSFLLMTPESANAQYRVTLIRDMMFFGALAALLITCLVIYFATRYIAYLAFSLFTFSLSGWCFRVFGYGFELLWPNSPQINDATYTVMLYSLMASAAWMSISALKRENRMVKYQSIMYGFIAFLLISGIFSSLFLSLNITLLIPLYWFFPAILLILLIALLEYRDGSQKARWFAYSVTPMILGTGIIVAGGMGLAVPVDAVILMMLGIVLTCLLLAMMISAYLIKILQNQRDNEQQQVAEATQQAQKLERLVKERTSALEESNQRLHDLASKDPLTELPNRRSLDLFVDDCLDAEYIHIGIAMVDLDHFKRLNDTYGHDVGDMVLCAVAKVLNPLNTQSQIAGRFGGEEFAIVVRQPQADEFENLLQNVHQGINQVRLPEFPEVKVKASIGWVISEQGESISECFRRADQALYQAKDQGRNRIISSIEKR